jgi:hypothetical protein
MLKIMALTGNDYFLSIIDVPHDEMSQWSSGGTGSNAAAVAGDDRSKSQIVKQVSFAANLVILKME